ncbi:MAG: pyridoxal phosphate-dependent aminotransferase [Planctomycetota bacterium]
MRENQRSKSLAGSSTLGLAARAKALAADGHPVISMAVGEPDFSAPPAVQAAAVKAVGSGQVRYTPAGGLPALRSALAREVSRTRGIEATAAEISVGHSCKHALANALMVLIEPGDEVLLFRPAWNSYDAQIGFAGGTPVWVPEGPDLRPDLDAIAAAITPRTKGMILNSPCNPSGVIWTRAEIEALGELAERHDLWLVSDEVYQRLVYTGAEFLSPVTLSPALRARTVIVDGASKAFAMTGYRIGYAMAPAPIAEAIERLTSQTTGCPNYISQMAWLAALENEPAEVEMMRRQFERRRDVLIPGLRKLGLEVPSPGGAFYAFPRVTEHLDGRTVDQFCAALLEQEHLAVVPGTTFGSTEHIRLSYALGLEDIEQALVRLGRFLG